MSDLDVNLQKLRDFGIYGLEGVYLSESEACLVALAYCDSEVLKREKLTAAEAWKRIDAQQLKALLSWVRPGPKN